MSRSVLSRMKNVSDKSCGENRNMHFMPNKFVWKSCSFWGNVKTNVGQVGHRWQYGACALHAGCLRLQTHTPSEYVIIIAFPPQQWLYERASMLRRTYVSSLLIIFELPETMALSSEMAWHRVTDLTTLSASVGAWNCTLPFGQSVQVSKLTDRSYKQKCRYPSARHIKWNKNFPLSP